MQLPPLRYDDPIFFYDFVSTCQGKLTIKMSPHDKQLITDNAVPSKNDPSERQFPIIKQNGTSGFFGVNGYFGAVPVWKYDLLSTCFIPERFHGFRLTGFNNQILDLLGDYAGPYMGPNEISQAPYAFSYQTGYQQMGSSAGGPGSVYNTADKPFADGVNTYGKDAPPSSYFDGDNVYFVSPAFSETVTAYNSPVDPSYPTRCRGTHAHISNDISGNIKTGFSLAVDFDFGLINAAPPNVDVTGVYADFYPSHGGYILGYAGQKGHYGQLSIGRFSIEYNGKTSYEMAGGGSPGGLAQIDYFTAQVTSPPAMQWINAEVIENNGGLLGGFFNSLICSDLSYGFETDKLEAAPPVPNASTFMIDPVRGGYVQGINFALYQQPKYTYPNPQPPLQKICDPGFYFPGQWGDALLRQVGGGTIDAIDYWDVGNGFRMRDPLRIGLSSQASGYFQTSRRRIKLDKHGDVLIPPNYLSAQLPDGGWLFLPPGMSGGEKEQTCTGFLVTGDGSAYWEVELIVETFLPPAWYENPFDIPDGQYFYPSGTDANISCSYGTSSDANVPYCGHGNFGISYDGVLFYIDTYRTPGVLYSSLGHITVTIPKAVIPKHEISTLCRQFGKCYYPWIG